MLLKISKQWCSMCFQDIQLGLEQHVLRDSPLQVLPFPNTNKLAEISCFTGTTIPKFKAPFYWFILDILFNTWASFKLYHELIDALSGTIWYTSKKAFVEMGNMWSMFSTFITFISFCVVGNMSLFQNVLTYF